VPSYNNSRNRRGFKRFLKMAKNSVRLSTPVLSSQGINNRANLCNDKPKKHNVKGTTCQDDDTKRCQENDRREHKKKCTKSKKELEYGFRLWDNRDISYSGIYE